MQEINIQKKNTGIQQHVSNTMSSLDYQLSKSLSHSYYVSTRPVKSNGLWCCVLLPIIIITYTWTHDVSNTYKAVACLSVGLLAYSILFIVFLSFSTLVLQKYGGCVVCGIISTLFICLSMNLDITPSLLLSMSATHLYYNFLKTILMCPKTFTIGEAMIVGQATVLSIEALLAKYFIFYEIDAVDYDSLTVNSVVDIAMITVAMIVILLFLLNLSSMDIEELGSIITGAAIYAFLMLHYSLGLWAVPRVLLFIFATNQRQKLLVFWLFLTIVAILVTLYNTLRSVKADTVSRKLFHVLAALVFTSGILVDLRLMYMAAGVMFSLLILLEALRKSEIDPISSSLQSAFVVYSDEKDCGSFAMTPIYLYLGLACPLVLVPAGPSSSLELLAGVLSVGVGDTAASVVGKRCGIHHWSGSNKTLEGTLANVFAQIVYVYALNALGFLKSIELLKTSVAAVATALVEAKTEQVDNLVVPLVGIIAFRFASILSSIRL